MRGDDTEFHALRRLQGEETKFRRKPGQDAAVRQQKSGTVRDSLRKRLGREEVFVAWQRRIRGRGSDLLHRAVGIKDDGRDGDNASVGPDQERAVG